MSASNQPLRLVMEPWDAKESRVQLDTETVVDLGSGVHQLHMRIPSGSIRAALNVERETAWASHYSIVLARVPDFILDPVAAPTRQEADWTEELRFIWMHSAVHERHADYSIWKGRPVIFEGARPGTYRAWIRDSERRLHWASDPFEVADGLVDLGLIELQANHPTRVSVSGFPALDPRDFTRLGVLAERVPEGNASDSIFWIEGDFEESLALLEGKYKLSLWYDNTYVQIPMAESEEFEVMAPGEFTWEIPSEAFAPLLEARARWDAEDEANE